MAGLTDFLSGVRVLEEVESDVNGKLTVVRDFTWGTYIQAGGLTQSGGVAKKVWKTALKKIYDLRFKNDDTLILGLGGGSIANLVNNFWSKAKITGVDLDLVMVELGKKYLGLDEKIKVVIGDAYKEINREKLKVKSYDLVCVDTYIGDNFPKKFESERFLKAVRRILSKGGIAIFNRLYYDEKRVLANKFEKKLEKVFSKVERIYPEANVMFVCKA